jgi:hypothetical protein
MISLFPERPHLMELPTHFGWANWRSARSKKRLLNVALELYV